jgi:hypothetical protein
MSLEELDGKDVVRVVKDSAVREPDETTFMRLKDINFKNGTIEVTVLSRLLPNAHPTAGGLSE